MQLNCINVNELNFKSEKYSTRKIYNLFKLYLLHLLFSSDKKLSNSNSIVTVENAKNLNVYLLPRRVSQAKKLINMIEEELQKYTIPCGNLKKSDTEIGIKRLRKNWILFVFLKCL